MGGIVLNHYLLPLFEGGLATPSLLSVIMTAKYTNAMTFYRLEEAISGNKALLTRQTMARWMIRAAEVYFSPLFDRLKHMMDDYWDMSFLDGLLPWSDALPAKRLKPIEQTSSLVLRQFSLFC